jgi:predicted nucleic acid-binding protein
MTGHLLDTNVLSEFSRCGEPDARVKRWLTKTERRSPRATIDGPIGATEHGLTVTTRNVKDFSGLGVRFSTLRKMSNRQ